jgi:Ankyrin repeats (3 copies)
LGQAERFLKRAVDSRYKKNPKPLQLIEESASLLVEVLLAANEVGKARAYRRWISDIRSTSGSMADTVAFESSQYPHLGAEARIPKLSGAYAWCKEKGFSVEESNFRFDTFEDIDGRITSPIHVAIEEQQVDVLGQMLEYAPNLELGPEHNTHKPLILAAWKRNCAIFELLVKSDAQLNVRDEMGRTVLHCCQHRKGGLDIISAILKAMPELVNAKDNMGKTALYTAIELGNQDAVRLQLRYGADPNIRSIVSTPLNRAIELAAARVDKAVIVRLLMESKADPDLTDCDGRTAVMAARNAGLAGSAIKSMLNLAQDRDLAKQSRNRPSKSSNSGAPVETTPPLTSTAKQSTMFGFAFRKHRRHSSDTGRDTSSSSSRRS